MERVLRDYWPQLLGGDSARFDVSITEVRLKSGHTFRPERSGVTVLVGANNSGKSTVLREIHQHLGRRHGSPTPDPISVTSLELFKAGEPQDVIAWIAESTSVVIRDQQAFVQRSLAGEEHPTNLIAEWAASAPLYLGGLSRFVTFFGDAPGRFSVTGSVEMRASIEDPPTHPVHVLQDDAEALERLNRLTDRVFGTRLTIDDLGRIIRLRVGTHTGEVPPANAITARYRSEIASLPVLDEQGDGIRGMLGIALPIVTGEIKIALIDEPEAFLHPPQAYAFGRELGNLSATAGLQVIVATHDRNFMTGLLDGSERTSVVRLTRAGGEAAAHQLDSPDLLKIWQDPVLRHTPVLEGLFHQVVVLAEADGDCAFFKATLDDMQATPFRPHEVLFLPTGGKAAMARFAATLRAVSVSVVASPDLDILNDRSVLVSLVEALGHEWDDETEGLFRQATAGMSAPRQQLKVSSVLAGIDAVLRPRSEEMYGAELAEVVKAQLRADPSRWDEVKQHGVQAFRGQAREALNALLDRLAQFGIVPVRAGELERLAPNVVAKKGPTWLPSALEAGAHREEVARNHLQLVLGAAPRR